jgi:acyl-CoA reductase-like NAD-dependent aldehyde dehydrogenase
VLIRSEEIGCLAFVGGRTNKAATSLADTGKRHFLEQEGLNAWGVWDFSQWDDLAAHLKKGFEYAKQRCTAYPRYVVQRDLVPAFLEMYLPVVKSLRFGHPLAVESPDDELPDLQFGPLISAAKAEDLRGQYAEAVTGGGIPLYRGSVEDGRFLDGQDTSAYVAPACIPEPPPSWSLRHAELDRRGRQRGRAARRDERQQRLSGRLRRHRRPRLWGAHRRGAAELQGRHQQAAQPRRPRRGLWR